MPRLPFQLSSTDHTYLDALLRKGQMGVKQFKRATGLLELARGKSITSIAETLGVSRTTVSTWAKRYRQEGLQMLHDKPRSGRPIEIDGTQRAKLTALACSEPPEGHSHWNLRLLADKAVELQYCDHICHTQVAQILKKIS
ncbi:helix-turn-helix domain-containing protein [Acaryochloris marina NIES-2412]|uniref:helix-turn-helix domain-containing protein n=1 Tax=Acaryochloris marina TaxID=155978 RepID=UPI00405A21E8